MNSESNPQVVWHPHAVSLENRASLLGQMGCVLWFTGLSGSGKSTVANALDQLLYENSRPSFLLDGDNIRHGLCATPNLLVETYGEAFAKRFGLGFSAEDREENIRRVGSVAQLLASAGLICLTAFVSPYRQDRDLVRKQIQSTGSLRFYEIFVDTPIEVCEQRDPKGLYRQAREGKIPNFTGISAPYESPENPEMILQGGAMPPGDLAQIVFNRLKDDKVLSSGG